MHSSSVKTRVVPKVSAKASLFRSVNRCISCIFSRRSEIILPNKLLSSGVLSGKNFSSMGSVKDNYKERHLFNFYKIWDLDGDGWLTAEDFISNAETLAVLQRHGKWEEDVVARWRSYLGGWWDILLAESVPANSHFSNKGLGDKKSGAVSFEDWARFLKKVSILADSYRELPDFLKAYGNLLFVRMDANKDGLICVKDYRMYVAKNNMDIMRSNDCYAFMLTSIDLRNDGILTRERFDELFYEYWTSHDPACKGQYILGPYENLS